MNPSPHLVLTRSRLSSPYAAGSPPPYSPSCISSTPRSEARRHRGRLPRWQRRRWRLTLRWFLLLPSSQNLEKHLFQDNMLTCLELGLKDYLHHSQNLLKLGSNTLILRLKVSVMFINLLKAYICYLSQTSRV